ncbi:MAG TPA: UDP-N-acetylmuramoyl-tripeptide--D-alanyl-D-alanine ligase [Candidatus Acidoferrum sp.]|nr:UDP-N-acetylmuramoyl-tripeptide--D-alanyl-D-alanine ligase [Candidatus Acidoferrum sp.]
MRWTLLQISKPMLAALGARLNPLARVAGVSIDSRTIRAGELFFAIHGPRHDGHDHVAAALGRGALAAVVGESRARQFPDELRDSCLIVDDTLRALHRLATAVRLAWGKKIAGVTGSVGKTTTKEILAALLGAKLRVLKSEGNFNNAYGLPLTLFRLGEEHDAAVLEMGMSRRYELQELAAIAKPDVGVVTRVAPAHLEFFASVDEIALAKRELIEGLNGRDSVAVLNADDPLVAAFAAHAPGCVLTYGIDNAADFHAEAIEDRGALGSAFILVENGKRTRLKLALPGRHVIANALAALAAASVWGIGAEEAQTVFRTLHAPAMRGELLRFSNGAALINDSYNSSPAALHAMIKVLAATPNYRRRILAAGEMRELGATSPQLHREAGKFASQTGKIDWVIGVEGDAAQLVEGAVAAGVPRAQTKLFASSDDAAKFLADFVAPGDLLLVKGSRGVKMERIVEGLLGIYAPDLESAEKVRH